MEWAKQNDRLTIIIFYYLLKGEVINIILRIRHGVMGREGVVVEHIFPNIIQLEANIFNLLMCGIQSTVPR